jgi:hypothetical protein
MLHAIAYWKAIIHFYLHSNSQVHRKIIAFVACPKQQKAILEGNLNGRCEENDVMNSLH